ncbi:MAG: NUDIX hydrolase [Deltaproteobacteria bacterium]|nr:NUDIX hydrolase [Deltaproteobacteria bacterium]
MKQGSPFGLKPLIESLRAFIRNPSEGLPEDVFLFVSTITPMVNVDLLIKNEKRQTLLTWRDDGHHPPSWHIPGGVIRYQETLSDRIRAVAAAELGAEVIFSRDPLAMNEVILPSSKIRGHFISLLYACTLSAPPAGDLAYRNGTPKPGQWAWHDTCPVNLIPVHEMYRAYF